MTEPYDLFVIGGGVNGAAVARDAAGRGLRVGLCERDDLAAHTSSASTKLIHGGLRYLEQGALRLVREALSERATLLRAAPHVVRPLGFVLPYHRGLRPAWMLRLGLVFYDRLGGRGPLPASDRVSLRGGPLEAEYGFGFRYWDCRVDDARLVVLNAIDARERGADILARTECVALRRRDDLWSVRLRFEGAEREVRTRAIVNAAGAWADGISDGIAPHGKPRLRLVKGSHIVTRKLYAGEHAFIFQNPDRRIVFAIPFEDDFTLIGTTDVAVRTPEEGERISPDEIAYLCDAVNEYLVRNATPDDVVWTFAGVRALHDDGDANPSRVSRDDRLILDADGAPSLSIIGGKLTTHRRVAERALQKLAPYLPAMGAPWTADAVLPGGDLGGDFENFVAALQREYAWAPAASMRRLAGAYGTRARIVLGDAVSINDLGRGFGADLYERELAYMMRHEFARTGEDALWRRSKLGLVLGEAERSAVDDWMRTT